MKKREKQNEDDAKSLTEDIPHKRNKVELGKAVCLFCAGEDSEENLGAAGEYHSGGGNPNTIHVGTLTETWKHMALQLGELDIHAKLCVGDVRAREIYYHKSHLVQFRNRFRNSHVQNEDSGTKRTNLLLECYAWKQVSNYIHESSDTYIAASELEKKYIALMDSYKLSYSPHISRFVKLLL